MVGTLDMGLDDLRSRLLGLDQAVAINHPGKRFRFVFVGGGALVLLGRLDRATSDLDALRFPAELLTLMESYDINARVLAFEDQFAYHIDDRLVPLEIGSEHIDYYTASIEDIVASKLYSDRAVDQLDVRRPEVLATIDWQRLREVADDMKGSMLVERRYKLFLEHYHSYRGEFGPCDD